MTQARGLNAVEYTDENIYIGFDQDQATMSCCIKCYDPEYELQYSIPVDLQENLFNDMSLMLGNKYIVGAHSWGFFSVTNLEE